MTTEIIKALGKRQVLRNHTPVVANITTIFDWEVDLFSVGKSGMTYEFEIKISRSDFIRDKKKRKWEMLSWKRRTPNYMSYACPDGLIQLSEIPDYFGLYYYVNGEIIQVREPKLRHSDIFDIHEIQMKVARMYSQREFLNGITLISHINKGIRERNAAREDKRNSDFEKLKALVLLKSEQEDKRSVATMPNSSTSPDPQTPIQ